VFPAREVLAVEKHTPLRRFIASWLFWRRLTVAYDTVKGYKKKTDYRFHFFWTIDLNKEGTTYLKKVLNNVMSVEKIFEVWFAQIKKIAR
jgi:hypothetical protein